MPKYSVQLNEWFPVLTLSKGESLYDYDPKELTDAEIADLRRVSAEFYQWQTKLAKLFDVDGFWGGDLIDDEDDEEAAA